MHSSGMNSKLLILYKKPRKTPYPYLDVYIYTCQDSTTFTRDDGNYNYRPCV